MTNSKEISIAQLNSMITEVQEQQIITEIEEQETKRILLILLVREMQIWCSKLPPNLSHRKVRQCSTASITLIFYLLLFLCWELLSQSVHTFHFDTWTYIYHIAWYFLIRFHYVQIDTLLACGGLAKNRLFVQEHADIIGLSLSLILSLCCLLMSYVIYMKWMNM